jgi:hypothetical protein
VAARHQLRDERLADGARGAGNEDPHDCSCRLIAL